MSFQLMSEEIEIIISSIYTLVFMDRKINTHEEDAVCNFYWNAICKMMYDVEVYKLRECNSNCCCYISNPINCAIICLLILVKFTDDDAEFHMNKFDDVSGINRLSRIYIENKIYSIVDKNLLAINL